MTIPLGRARRLLSMGMYVCFLLVVSAVLVVMFVRFTANLRLALALVVFMVGYMLVMGYIVMKRDDSGRGE